MQLESTAAKILALVMAVMLHEVAHGWMAYRLGDPTAKLLGRITLNPLRHIDPVGSIILPGFLILSGSPFIFGWAKPVPVNFGNLHSKGDAILVSVAGVTVNLACAMAAGFLLQVLWPGIANIPFAALFLGYFTLISIILGVFNLIPVPPLDGGRIVTFLLPTDLALRFGQIERFGILIVMILLMTGVLNKMLLAVFVPLLKIALGGVQPYILG